MTETLDTKHLYDHPTARSADADKDTAHKSSKTPDHIAVLIPCYNEALTIKKVITDWHHAIPECVIYVYDNNSTDGTDQIAASLDGITGKVEVRHEYAQGKGNVIRAMFRDIEAICYIMVDGDDTYPAEYGRQMADIILSHRAEMVVGDRLSSTYFEENKRPFHNFGNELVRSLINRMFRTDIHDIMTGYRAFSRLFVKSFPVLSRGFEIETEMTIHAVEKRLLVENVVIQYRDRPEGSVSKLNTYSDGLKVLRTIFRLYKNYKPMSFFGLLSSLFGLASAALFIPVFIEYLDTGLVPNFPTLIVSGFLALAMIVSFFSGLILSTIIEQDRQQFEFRLIDLKHQWK